MIWNIPPRAMTAEIRRKIFLFENTLRRLVRGDFDDLPDAERQERVFLVIGLCADAATGLAAMPVPFLELPVHAAMVGAIGKIHGHTPFDRKGLKRILASIGGGMALRQLTRLAPFFGRIPFAARVHGATWTLGLAAQTYFENYASPTDMTADDQPAGQPVLCPPTHGPGQNGPDTRGPGGASQR